VAGTVGRNTETGSEDAIHRRLPGSFETNRRRH
jgi:hypothetical protein